MSANAPFAPPLTETAHAILAAAWRRRRAIAVPMIVLPILGGVFGHFAPRAYETRMTIQIQDLGKQNPYMEDISVRTNLRDRIDAFRALLNSRRVLVAVAEDIGAIPRGADEQARDAAVRELASAVSMQLIGQEVIELRYRARGAEGIDRVLTRIGERFMERVVAPDDSSTQGSVAFLSSQLRSGEQALQLAEAALSDFRSKNGAQLPELRSSTIQRIAQLREQLADRETRLAGAEADLAATRQRMAQNNPVVLKLEQEVIGATAELAQLRSRYTEEHSRVQAAARKVERLDQERSAMVRAAQEARPEDAERLWGAAAVSAAAGQSNPEIAPLLSSQVASLELARGKVDQLRGEAGNLRATLDEIASSFGQSGDIERDLRALERDVAVKSDVVQQMRRRFEIARVSSDLTRYQAPERIRIIDRPVEPRGPVQPMGLLFTIAGIVAGIGIGGGLAMLLEMADQGIRRSREMERLLGAPVLARLPRLPGDAPLDPEGSTVAEGSASLGQGARHRLMALVPARRRG